MVAGLWKLSIILPPSYPLHPPTIKFLTPICHPNVHFQVRTLSLFSPPISLPVLTEDPLTPFPTQTGEICLSLLKESWSPAYTLTSTLEAIHQLLAYPEVDSPLNVDVAVLLKEGDQVGGEGLVRFWCGEKRWGG